MAIRQPGHDLKVIRPRAAARRKCNRAGEPLAGTEPTKEGNT
jgi:hypothetical protein